MEDFIRTIVKPLVNHPEDVVVTSEETDLTILYKLSVQKEDIGRVIGKKGRIARAIRTLLYANTLKNNKKIRLEIVE